MTKFLNNTWQELADSKGDLAVDRDNQVKRVNKSAKLANEEQHSATQNDYPGQSAVIRAVGVGGGGCNAINRMVEVGVKGVDFIAINTDNQALELNKAETRVRIGDKLTRGLGAGADPEVGEKAATESRDEISGLLRGTDLLFITAGMGGGTGTGASPVVAQVAQDMGILTVAVVTRPFRFEGARRSINAEKGIEELAKYVDSLIIVPNDKLLDIADEDTTIDQAFAMADHVLRYGITGISDLVAVPGLINLDMADVRRVMTDAGICHMGIGRAQGPDRVEDAIDEAIHSPLLDTNIDGAEKIIINFTGSNMKLREISEATSLVRDSANPNADIIMGAVPDEDLDDEIMITIIASGFGEYQSDNFEGNEVNTDSFRTIGTESSRVNNKDNNQTKRDNRQSERNTHSFENNQHNDSNQFNQYNEYNDYNKFNENKYQDASRTSRETRQNQSQSPNYRRDYDQYYDRPARDNNRQTSSQNNRNNSNNNAKNNGRILPWLFNDDEQ